MDTLPIRIEPEDEAESGLGFLFRCLHANGLSLKEAQHWLKLKGWVPMQMRELTVWAWITGANRDWLTSRTVIADKSWDGGKYGLNGHRFGTGGVALAHSARICPACIKYGRCHRLSWQVAGVPACAIHGQVLMDRCPNCGLVISWNRPAIDVCSCGRFLTGTAPAVSIPPVVSAWVRWVEARLFNCAESVRAQEFGVPALFDAMSIDGGMRVVVAAGLLPSISASPGKPSQMARTTKGMAEIVARGLERLAKLKRDFANLSELRPVLHLPAVERMRAQAVTSADEAVADMFLGQIDYLSRRDLPERRWSRRRQKVLF